MAYGQQLSYHLNSQAQPGLPPPPPPTPVTFPQSASHHGMYGEQMAAGGMSAAGMAGGMALGGAQIYGMMGGGGMLGAAGRTLDPFTWMGRGFSAGYARGGQMGMGMMGRGMMGAAMGGAAALPLYGVYKAASMYGGAFTGGMQDQAAMNQTLRSNFQHFGGGGAMGRGFGQQQMGAIGANVAGVVRNDPFLSMGEATSLIGQGAQGGMFTGVREVSEFTQKFKSMLDTLKGVQRELGGSLSEAMTFVNEAKASGVFQTSDRLRLASGMRTTQAVTGMNAMQVGQMQQFGSQLARAVGGRASQGAFGAQRAMQQVGSMVQSGALNEEQIYEITGQTGAQGQMAFAQNMMQKVARFSRRGMGRYSIFGMANENGTGLDAGQLARFTSGDMGVGELSRRAHGNVNRMGRARSINQEGNLRGALLEQGGIAGQIGMMRMMVGDRLEGMDDDLGSLVLQRRFHMERPEAEAMMSLMRNQGSIARQESLGRVGSARQAAQQRRVESQSWDSNMDRIGNTMANSFGVTAASEMGQRAMTKLSSAVERALNDMLGIVSTQMTGGTAAAQAQASIGRATGTQMARIRRLSRASGMTESIGGSSGYERGLFEVGLNWGGERTRDESLEVFGFDPSGFGGREGREAVQWSATDAISEAFRNPLQSPAEARQNALARRRARIQALKNQTAPMSERARQQASVSASRAMSGQVSGAALDAMESFAGQGNITAQIQNASMMARGARNNGNAAATLFDYMEGAEGSDQRLGLTALMARQGMDLQSEFGDDPTRLAGGANATNAFDRIDERAENAAGWIGSNRSLSRRASGARAKALAGAAVDGEVVSRLYSEGTSGDIISGIIAASESGDAEAVQRGIANLRAHGNSMTGEDAGALQNIAAQMEQEAAEYGGKIGRHHRSVGMSGEDVRGFVQSSQALGRTVSRMAGSMTGALAERLSGISDQLMTRGSEREGYGGVASLRESFVHMSDDEANAFLSSANESLEGATEEDRAQVMALTGSLTRERALQRDLTGRGRRGTRQANETALNMISGGTLSGMELTVGGRQVSGRNIQSVITNALSGRGRMSGDERASVQQQVVEQLRRSGIDNAEEMVNQLSSSLTNSESGEGIGRISEEEANRLRATVGENQTSIDKASERAMEQRQRAQNPLDFERNQTLTQILQAIREGRGEEDGKGAGGTVEGGTPRGEDA